MTRALLRVFVCAHSVFPIPAYTEQPAESSSDETPTLCQPARAQGSPFTYPATTPRRTHPASLCLIMPQTTADKEIRCR